MRLYLRRRGHLFAVFTRRIELSAAAVVGDVICNVFFNSMYLFLEPASITYIHTYTLNSEKQNSASTRLVPIFIIINFCGPPTAVILAGLRS